MPDPTAPARIAIVGCGNIFDRYVAGMARFPELQVIGCADLDPVRAERAAERAGIIAYPGIDALLGDQTIDLVINLTAPVAHASVSLQALSAGKDVFVEKPLTATLGEAEAVLASAALNGRVVGSAPDTFLGSALQTAKGAIDAGAIGDVLGGSIFIGSSRVEQWHPDPTFLFQPGGGPVLDMGPYYVTHLVALLGSVVSVAALGRIGREVRVITAAERVVDEVVATVSTHVNALLSFANGAQVTATMTFDVFHRNQPFIELYGTDGSLNLPNPNEFDGPVLLRRNGDDEWAELPPVFEPSGAVRAPEQYLRGLGVRDLVRARSGEPQRTSGALAFHVLEVLEAIATAAAESTVVPIRSTVERPAAVFASHKGSHS